MSNYNLVYGNPFNPSYGLANAAQKRIDTINKTLARQKKKGKQSQVLLDRKEKLQELIDREQEQKNQIIKDRMEREDKTPPGIVDTTGGGEFDTSNTPPGIVDTTGGGEFSSPGGGRDMGSIGDRAGASYASVQDDDYGLL